MISRAFPLYALLALSLTAGGTAVAHDAAAPAAAAQRYRLADGSVAIFGNDGMADMLSRFNALVARQQPRTRFTMTLKGSSTGLPALTANATLLAPLARDAWRNELAAFRQVHGYDATSIRIGYSGWGPRASGKTPPAIYVNADNPLKDISLADLARVFTKGAVGGDIAFWSQLGLTGEAGKRQIHLYGLDDDGGSATAFRFRTLGGLNYAVRYEPLESNQAVIRAVAADPYGVGITGWVDAAKVSQRVRIVAVHDTGGRPVLPGRADVAAGAYPLTMPVQFYVDRVPGKPLDPLAKAYIAAALSDAGQAVIASQSDGPDGYLPLSPGDLAAERAKLDAM